MLHIHYEKGPDVLKDVPIATSDEIIKHIKNKEFNEQILTAVDCSDEVIDELRSMLSKHLRRCVFCGDYFKPNTARRTVCFEPKHYLPCIDCGTPVEVKESFAMYMKAGGRRCQACRAKQIGETRRNLPEEAKHNMVAKQEQTMLKKYGYKNANQVPEIQRKIRATVKERYGVDNLSQSKEIQNRIKENSQKRFGVDHYSQDSEIRRRMTDGMLAKYGVTSPQQCEELRKKTEQTNIERYGVPNPLQNKEIQQKGRQTSREKYGFDWAQQNPEVKARTTATNIQKYGAPMFPVSDEYMKTFIKDPHKFDNYKAFMNDPEGYIRDHYKEKPSVGQLTEDLGVTDSPIYDKLIAIDKQDIVSRSTFTMENQIVEFLRNLKLDINIQMHNRSILEGKEIDIYLPEFDIGIECNPTYTHNSTFADPWGSPPKHYKYHADKSKLANEKGIFVYHVFGYEWTNHRSKIQSQIRNLLGLNSSVLYARRTHVKEISAAEAAAFLDANHRQGNAVASVRLGLFTIEEELVSVMTFCRVRAGAGKKESESPADWELLRFANLQNTTVTGGASKLFQYFITHYDPEVVVSFSDLAHTKGKLYDILGFSQVSVSDPGYVWVYPKDDSYYTRQVCQKSNLVNLFEDVTQETIKNSTETEIMSTHGYVKVFDSGVIRWEYRKEI